ncbi:diaminopimelate aminotransferase [Fervidicella metallireducens AeB]|uniref:Diaminopimelate aminotransferase n=1 Tax=Fervidicella metallireducens AeB TaxID=1403537 RepID=A0A017RXE5_9CLOT|nr:LL-diaminopimelate aminotransferase [Fervidicella metallireducens]EYE89266.1 diaminopimelate aminotransferase [Fervidicella metallireducens AeB]
MKITNRTSKVPAYIFSRVDKIKRELFKKGISIIDLGIGDPDLPTPDFVINTMEKALKKNNNHRYPPYNGTEEFRKSVSNYYLKNFNVALDAESEVVALIGSKEGIAHLMLAVTDPGDYVLIPDPGYPVYYSSAVIAGCNVYKMYLQEKNDYLIKLENIFSDVAKKAKLLIVNYPNNPTGAIANIKFYRDLINFGKENDVIIVNDGAYMDILENGVKPISLLQIDDAKDVCVEFGTLSKSFNMTGWRLGYVVGNKEVLRRLMIVKTNFDSGQFSAIQEAGANALNNNMDFVKHLQNIYDERRNLVTQELESMGFNVYKSKGAFYIWFKIPEGFKSEEFAAYLLENTGVIITPGNAFGDSGEGYCRISLTTDSFLLKEAMERIRSLKTI